MLKRLATALWGEMSSEEWKKFLSLGGIFGLIIGTYWTLRPLKDGLFSELVGMEFAPDAKIVSLCVIVPLVMLYGKVVDRFPREKVFYVLTGLYGTLSVLFAFAMMHPKYGLGGTEPSHILGYAWYVFVESFGSLIVALFWALTSDITLPESAKKGYYFVTLLGQIGGVMGPRYLKAKHFGFKTSAPIILILATFIIGVGLLIKAFMTFTPKDQLVGYKGDDGAAKEETGFLEGLKLLLSKPYLLAIFAVISIYEVIVTILDYRFKLMARANFPIEIDFTAYLNDYAQWVNFVAMLCIVLGVSNIQRRLGLSVSLALLPLMIASAVVTLKAAPVLSVAFVIMVAAKAVNYALNGPSLKQLYIPTSTDTKYKASAWIEMFGSRGSKAIGSTINKMRQSFLAQYGLISGDTMFMAMSSYLSLGLIGFWFFIALYLGRTHKKAIQENKIIC
ncbi:hypothetical protein JW872_02075 [Candidatus Babeliales bacterium]|nr:hypothetical protein [Candidatus Babeliales bacterium]